MVVKNEKMKGRGEELSWESIAERKRNSIHKNVFGRITSISSREGASDICQTKPTFIAPVVGFD